MKIPESSDSTEIKPFELAIVARGTARLTFAELAEIRKQPPACFSPKLSPLFLKHSDEQTLAALTALYRAIGEFSLKGEDFDRWGIVSISRYLGRGAFATLSNKFATEGAWGVSVQVIPHRTAHSVSGTISLGLAAHGPAIGANGGTNGERTGLLALPSIMHESQANGVWLVCSRWMPELSVDRTGRSVSDSVCLAAVLALVRTERAEQFTSLGYLRIGSATSQSDSQSESRSDSQSDSPAEHLPGDPDAGLLAALFDETEHRCSEHRIWRRMAGGGLQVEIGLTAAGVYR